MSLGNTNEQGTKGNNYTWQRAVLTLLNKIAAGIGPTTTPSYASGDTLGITDGAAHLVISAAPAAQFIYITHVIVTNSHASVGTLVSFQDNLGNAIYGATGYAAPAGGGYVAAFAEPIKLPVAAGALYVVCGTSGANVNVSVVGYKGA